MKGLLLLIVSFIFSCLVIGQPIVVSSSPMQLSALPASALHNNSRTVCPGAATGTPGFRPSYDQLPCIVSSAGYQESIEFEVHSTLGSYTLDSIHFEYLGNIPCGINYYFDRADRTYFAGEVACITFNGSSTDQVGQYELEVRVRLYTHSPSVIGEHYDDLSEILTSYNVDSERYFLRMKGSNASACIPVNANSAGQTAMINCLPLSVTATEGTTICPGVSVTLTANATGGTNNYSYTWSPGGMTGASIVVSPTSNTTYTVTVNDGVSTSTANAAVSVVAAPVADIGNDVTICQGGAASLSALASVNSSYTYSWSPSIGLSCTSCAMPIATPISTTTYSVTVDNGLGCSSTDEVVVSVGSSALAEVRILADELCSGGRAEFTALPVNGGAPSYQWTLNGNSVGVDAATLVIPDLSLNDEVACTMTSNLVCVTNDTATSNVLIAIDCTTGLLDIAKQHLNVSVQPNPTKGLVYVKLDGIQNGVTIEVFNMQGQRVFATDNAHTTSSIDLSDIKQGLYIMRVSTDNGVATTKVIKE